MYILEILFFSFLDMLQLHPPLPKTTLKKLHWKKCQIILDRGHERLITWKISYDRERNLVYFCHNNSSCNWDTAQNKLWYDYSWVLYDTHWTNAPLYKNIKIDLDEIEELKSTKNINKVTVFNLWDKVWIYRFKTSTVSVKENILDWMWIIIEIKNCSQWPENYIYVVGTTEVPYDYLLKLRG